MLTLVSVEIWTDVPRPLALAGDDAQNGIVNWLLPLPLVVPTRIFWASAVSAQPTAIIAATLPYRDKFLKLFSIFTIMRSTLLVRLRRWNMFCHFFHAALSAAAGSQVLADTSLTEKKTRLQTKRLLHSWGHRSGLSFNRAGSQVISVAELLT